MRRSRTEVVDTVRAFAPEAWDAATGDHVLASHAWLRALEEAGVPGVAPRYVLVREGGGPVGAAVCYVNRGGQPGLDPDDLLLGQLQPLAGFLGFSFSPALLSAPFRGYGVQLFGPAREALLDELEALARAERLPLHFPRVPEEEADLCRLLRERGYHRTADQPLVVLDVAWATFDSYLKGLKRVGRRAEGSVRREINRSRRAGVTIRAIENVTAAAPRLHELARAHELRRNGRPRPPYPPSLLPCLKRGLGDRCVVYGAFRNGEVVGFAVLVRDRDSGYLPFFGLDDAKGNFTYFNLGYYQPIRDAIGFGLRRLHFGRLLCGPKARRGCWILRTQRFHRGATQLHHLAAAPWFGVHARVARRRFARAYALADAGPRA